MKSEFFKRMPIFCLIVFAFLMMFASGAFGSVDVRENKLETKLHVKSGILLAVKSDKQYFDYGLGYGYNHKHFKLMVGCYYDDACLPFADFIWNHDFINRVKLGLHYDYNQALVGIQYRLVGKVSLYAKVGQKIETGIRYSI